MDLITIGKYAIGVILILAGLVMIALGDTNTGVGLILAGLGFLGLAKETEQLKQEVKALKK